MGPFSLRTALSLHTPLTLMGECSLSCVCLSGRRMLSLHLPSMQAGHMGHPVLCQAVGHSEVLVRQQRPSSSTSPRLLLVRVTILTVYTQCPTCCPHQLPTLHHLAWFSQVVNFLVSVMTRALGSVLGCSQEGASFTVRGRGFSLSPS